MNSSLIERVEELVETKICNKCREEKLVSEFYFRKDLNAYRADCKECVKAKKKEKTERDRLLPLPEGRACTKCGEYKTREHFHVKYGKLRPYCIDCGRIHYVLRDDNGEAHKKQAKKYRDANKERSKIVWKINYTKNKERMLAKGREWYYSNLDTHYAKRQAFYIANPEKKEEKRLKANLRNHTDEGKIRKKRQKKEYVAKNPDSMAVYQQNQRARKLSIEGKIYLKDIRELKEKQECRCHYCGDSIELFYEIEHAQPLSKGGTNNIENIRLSCYQCNRSKGTKTEKEFFDFMKKTDRFETIELLKYWR